MPAWGIIKLKEPIGKTAYVRADKVKIELVGESQVAQVLITASFLAADGSTIMTADYFGGRSVSPEFAKLVTQLVTQAAHEVAGTVLGVNKPEEGSQPIEGAKESFPPSI
jgi:hypothetical protein